MNYLCKCKGCGAEVWVPGPICNDPETGALDINEEKIIFDCECPDFDYEIIDSEYQHDDPNWERE